MTAKRILMAEAVLLAAGVLALVITELPGMRRELRILRMVGFRRAARNAR
ncbi:hypothetical protein OEB94_00560 [Streptomyces sp. ICN988]|nr:hypothetical protein [Streptomyces sp. ICN988]MCV2457793.1 hypothetical protein [Streptomyces sp. ICN988]